MRALTVRRLVADPALRLRLVAGLAHGGARVRSAHTIDLDSPARYVLPGELVLTNGLWIGRVSADDWVNELAAAGATAIGFGLSSDFPELPVELVEAAERHGLALLCAPSDLSFALLSEHVAELGQQPQQDTLRQQLHRTRQLAEGVAGGGGHAALLDQLRRHTGVTGTFVGPGNRVLARNGSQIPRRTLTAAVRLAFDGALPQSVADAAAAFCAPGPRARSILVIGSPMHVLDAATLLLIEQVVAWSAVEDARLDAEREVRGQLAGELLGRIRRGQLTEAEFDSRLEALGMDPAGALRAIATTGQPRVLIHAVESLRRPYALVRIRIGTADGSGDWLVLLDGARDDDAVALAAAIRKLGAEPVLGWGSRGIGSGGLRRSVLEATSCLTGAKQRPADDRLVGPADAASHELLLAVVDGSVTRAYAEQVLGPLVDWDLSHGSTLVETLREFLAVGGRWTEAAQALHIHPNTLRYRLDRVEQLTSRSLADSGDRVDVYLALKLLGDA